MINLLPEELRKAEQPIKKESEVVKLHRPADGAPKPQNGAVKQQSGPLPHIAAHKELPKKVESATPVVKREIVNATGKSPDRNSGWLRRLFGRKVKLTMDLLKVENEEVHRRDFFLLMSQIMRLIFVFALIYVVIFSAAKFFNLRVLGQELELNKKLAIVQKDIAQYESSQSDYVKISNRFSAIKSLLEKHIDWGKFFNYLEAYTLPSVNYSELVADDNGKVTLSAIADDYLQLALQLKVFQSAKDFVKKVEINSGSLTGAKSGQVGFQVNIDLVDKFLYAGNN